MNKGVSNLYHYREVSRSSNCRYLEALATVDNPTAAYRQVAKLVEPQVVDNRRHAGFNPARTEDVKLFQAILHGDHIARGFRNADIRSRLYAPGPLTDPNERRRKASAVIAEGRRDSHAAPFSARLCELCGLLLRYAEPD